MTRTSNSLKLILVNNSVLHFISLDITNTQKKRTRIFQMREHVRLTETYHCILRIKLSYVVSARPMPLRNVF